MLEAERAAAAEERAASEAVTARTKAAEAATASRMAQRAVELAQREATAAAQRAEAAAEAAEVAEATKARASFTAAESQLLAFGARAALGLATPPGGIEEASRDLRGGINDPSPTQQRDVPSAVPSAPTPLAKVSRAHLEERDCPAWDVQVAIHCVRPTGKPQPPAMQLKAAITAATTRAARLTRRLKRSVTAIETTEAKLRKLKTRAAKLEGESVEANAVLTALSRLEQKSASAHAPSAAAAATGSGVAASAAGAASIAGASPAAAASAGRAAAAAAPRLATTRNPTSGAMKGGGGTGKDELERGLNGGGSYTHTHQTVRAAWRGVLEPLRARLASLHSTGLVESAVLGFTYSDAKEWRQFWTPASSSSIRSAATSPSGIGGRIPSPHESVQGQDCLGPDRSTHCPCAYCCSRRLSATYASIQPAIAIMLSTLPPRCPVEMLVL